MSPHRVALTSEEEVGIELIRLDWYVSVNNMFLLDIVTATEWNRLCRRSRLDWLEDICGYWLER
jgi:hypothetical protein